jgi:AcrR family transcriptional regulator
MAARASAGPDDAVPDTATPTTDAGPDSVFFRPPRPRRSDTGLSLERIVGAAVELLDRDGPSALTMRKFAAELGVHATSLYWYVKRREDLIDLAVDEILRDAAEDVPTGPWDAVVRHTAAGMYAAFRDHAWVASSAGTRPLIGPNAVALSGRVLAALSSTGASDRDVTIAATTLSNLILGSATAASAAQALGLSDPDSPLARQVVAAVGAVHAPPSTSAVWNPYFEESLELVLDGVRALLEPGATRRR